MAAGFLSSRSLPPATRMTIAMARERTPLDCYAALQVRKSSLLALLSFRGNMTHLLKDLWICLPQYCFVDPSRCIYAAVMALHLQVPPKMQNWLVLLAGARVKIMRSIQIGNFKPKQSQIHDDHMQKEYQSRSLVNSGSHAQTHASASTQDLTSKAERNLPHGRHLLSDGAPGKSSFSSVIVYQGKAA